MADGTDRVPDPTQRTIETLQREIGSVLEKAMAALDGVESISNERFRSIERQMALVEQQRVEQKKDTKDAVDAALTAQKEAVKEQTTASERAIAKSEMATAKQLDQLTATFTVSISGVTDLLNDTKDRVSKLEAGKAGHQAANAQMIALAAICATLFGGAITAIIIKLFGG